MHRAPHILLILLLLVTAAPAQTFTEGDYQLNRKKATAGFEVAELLAGSNITFTWDNTAKTLTLSGSAGTGGTSITTLGTIITGTWQATAIADTYIASAATWNAKQTALVSGTNIKTINGNSLLGSGNLTITGGIADGDTLTTGLTFPVDTLNLINEEAPSYHLKLNAIGSTQNADRRLNFDVNNQDRQINLSGDLTVSATATVSGNNTGDQDLTNYLTLDGDGSALTGLTAAQVGAIDATDPTFSLDAVSGYGRLRLYDANNAIFQDLEAIAGGMTFSGTVSASNLSNTNTGDITLAGTPDYITLTDQTLTRNAIDLTTDVTGTLPVANGGTGITSPGTSGNVLTSDGTNWTSSAPTTGANPAGSGSELQFRSDATTFGAVTGSTVSGANIASTGTLTLSKNGALSAPTFTLTGTPITGGTTTTTKPLVLIEPSGATSTAWSTSGTLLGVNPASGFVGALLDLQNNGSSAMFVDYRGQIGVGGSAAIPSAHNISSGYRGVWMDTSNSGVIGETASNFRGVNLVANAVRQTGIWWQQNTARNSFILGLGYESSNNGLSLYRAAAGSGNTFTALLLVDATFLRIDSGMTLGWSDLLLGRDAANTLAQRNGTNAQTYRLYETDSGANDEYLELSAASGTNTICPKATGSGTASVVRYHTTTAVFWTSGSGSPESVVTAPVGSMYTDTAGGAGTTLYVKESGTGSTGWVAK